MTCSTNQQPTNQKQTTEDVEIAQELTVDRENYNKYNRSSDQDNNLENDISIVGSDAGEDDDNAEF